MQTTTHTYMDIHKRDIQGDYICMYIYTYIGMHIRENIFTQMYKQTKARKEEMKTKGKKGTNKD